MTETEGHNADGRELMANAPRKAAPARRFDFAHKVFQVEGGLFQPDPQTEEPVFSVDMGELRANLTFTSVRTAFGIAPDDPDSKLLDEVGRALAYVRRIRPGDAIPSELLDGTASWRIDEHHRAAARGRISIGLVAWMSGRGSVQNMSTLELAKIADDPETKARVQQAFGKLADDLGLPADKRGDVVKQIDKLVDELAYIEALRENVARARRVLETLKRLRAVYKRERGVHDEIERTVALSEPPVHKLEMQLTEVDAQSGETANALRTLPRQIAFIREVRDRLHSQMMKWDDILEAWQGVTAEPSARIQKLVRDTYRFVARHFPAESEWVR
ncbi:MAG: hypothetical protein GC202_08685 [Alphaproteobacteria bacterium]|nr:hypothetical protein [Alphaproteobacteria bacterium]